MERAKKLVSFRTVRFALVGIGNTAVNFAILNFAFYVLNQGKIVSSIIATSCAVAFSFALNRNFVFAHKTGKALHQLILFVVVTVSGVMLVQNAVFALGVRLLPGHETPLINLVESLAKLRLSPDFIDVNLSNAVASLAVMFWNYNGYRLFVFKQEEEQSVISETARP
ncbi:MAG TPA: GtrA family protein [Nevskiaceae bacterium]|nr:GtrA family protein [Nevskiaceae bacterium]